MNFGLFIKNISLLAHRANIFYNHYFHMEILMMERQLFPFWKVSKNACRFLTWNTKQWMPAMIMKQFINKFKKVVV